MGADRELGESAVEKRKWWTFDGAEWLEVERVLRESLVGASELSRVTLGLFGSC